MKNQAQKIVLVTGSSGFIGSALVKHLLKNTQHVVVNIDKLTYAACTDALSTYQCNSRYHFITETLVMVNALKRFSNNISRIGSCTTPFVDSFCRRQSRP